jgi:hypothetical protein
VRKIYYLLKRKKNTTNDLSDLDNLLFGDDSGNKDKNSEPKKDDLDNLGDLLL